MIFRTVEYLIATESLSLSAIRTIRVLRPLRAINRVPSIIKFTKLFNLSHLNYLYLYIKSTNINKGMRILVMLLLDTLPMLGNVLLLCFFVFFIFGIVGVQLWKGVLRNRCWFVYNQTLMAGLNLESYNNTFYKPEHTDSFICTDSGTGMSTCADIPPFVNNSLICNSTIETAKMKWQKNLTLSSCINWNSYYAKCESSGENPFKGAISFDNIGYAWVAIFQVLLYIITLL